ncbi:sugar transferase [Novosphingobium album (ex Liu et al. 2023)]|uniref:Sugar transferase n=1 Tax=Novosphingobium album (ex Liu et al. 2023) TaxID=3031130 RepID=A0ABT5WSY5_9SPHN|nr:sugar transferase [Novosphingobium album (ex Liu et al. 2023)]MDE8653166.1 sugar transferase [Novosphingobium album (ex Liu et al. 2023)]
MLMLFRPNVSDDEVFIREVGAKRRRRRQYLLLLVALDTLGIFSSFLLAAWLYDIVSKFHWLVMACAILPFYLAFAANSKAYSGIVFSKQKLGVSRSYTSLIQSVGIVSLIGYLFKSGDHFSRVNFAMGAIFSFVMLAAIRGVFLKLLHRMFDGSPYTTLLIHDGSIPAPAEDYTVVEHVDDWLGEGGDLPGRYNRLGAMLSNSDRVIVACAPERRGAIVHTLKGSNVRSEVLVPELSELAPLAVSNSGDVTTLIVAQGPLSPFDQFVKRCFDLGIVFVALPVALPVMLIAALAIRLESPGSIFFVQSRMGKDNRVFRMLKFRSMRIELADASADRLVTRDDERVTRVGRFIRRTSIDELPQLINVLAGTMSIVGPRPHALGAKAATKLYWEVDERYWYRHAVKPGLTGLAQVRGHRGNTEHEMDLTDRLHADLEYLSGWSLLRDMSILARTLQVVASNKAY